MEIKKLLNAILIWVGSIPNVITVRLCALAQNIASGDDVNSYVAIPVVRKLGGVLTNLKKAILRKGVAVC